LQEYRYTAYQNLRLLDEVTSALLLHKSVVSNIQPQQAALFGQFNYLFGNKPQNALGKWDWALALQQVFTRLIEDQINVNLLQQAGGPWAALLQADAVYEQALANTCACDFSRLLRYFREFLDTAQGNLFLSGDGSGVRLPLTHVLVDEYQDTNPIQESIYLRLSDTPPHNITVVGDDDQALYRFRGGTVECMVGFSAACQARWGTTPQIIYLSDNHRSDSDIVQWCNTYITSFPQMAAPNVRIPGKPPLNPALGRTGAHPAVGIIRNGTVGACATGMATLVNELRANGIIQDYSQCVLLLRSTKNSPNFAGPYVTALQARNIPIYNPRSKDYLEQPEVCSISRRVHSNHRPAPRPDRGSNVNFYPATRARMDSRIRRNRTGQPAVGCLRHAGGAGYRQHGNQPAHHPCHADDPLPDSGTPTVRGLSCQPRHGLTTQQTYKAV
jgi:DNA helicase-2/ATP-dependent DNA helicase PcrA